MSEIDLLRYIFQFLKALIKKKYCPEGASRVGLCGRGGEWLCPQLPVPP